MAKSFEHRDTDKPGNPAWTLSRHAWLDQIASRYSDVLLDQGRDNRAVSAKLLTISDFGKIRTKTSYLRIRSKLQQAKNFSEAVDVILDVAWGAYILVLDEMISSRRLFMADPLYSVRLYYTADTNGDIQIDTSVENLLKHTSIRWNLNYLSEFATTQFGPIGETAFSDIKVVPPGCALVIDLSGKCVIERVWRSSRVCVPDIDLVCAEAIGDVYSSIAEGYPNVCAAISGGVDSSSGAIFLRKALGPDTRFGPSICSQRRHPSSTNGAWRRKSPIPSARNWFV